MRLRSIFVFCLLLTSVSASLFAQEPVTATSATPNSNLLSNPDTPDGLRDLLKSLAAAIHKPDIQESDRITHTLVLVDTTWLTNVFGADLGVQIANRCAKSSNWASSFLISTIRSSTQSLENEIVVTRIERGDHPTSQNLQAVLTAMINPAPLYLVQITKSPNEKLVEMPGAFIYEGGTFHYVPENSLLDVPGTIPSRIRVKADVMQSMRTYDVAPKYPAEAKRKHIQGTVVLEAIIGKDGKVQQLQATSGPPELIPAALEAVQHWEYKPTLLKEQPVEVVTLISVRFTLGPP